MTCRFAYTRPYYFDHQFLPKPILKTKHGRLCKYSAALCTQSDAYNLPITYNILTIRYIIYV